MATTTTAAAATTTMTTAEAEEPEELLCPITQELLENPVMDRQGVSYSRAAIEQWLRDGHETSPVTGQALSLDDLRPNLALAATVDAYRRQQAEAAEAQTQTQAQAQAGAGAAEEENAILAALPLPPTAAAVQQQQRQRRCQQQRLQGMLSAEQYNLAATTCHAPQDVPAGGDAHGANTVLSVIPTDQQESLDARTPSDICVIVDVSGSMNSRADVQDMDEDHGLSVLDVVKHALVTITESLGPDDRIAIVSFSCTAEIKLRLTSTRLSRKGRVLDTIRALAPRGRTNLWDGISKGMAVFAEDTNPLRNRVMMLLTDGKPNVRPNKGEVHELRQLRSTSGLNIPLHTFGFGYNLDSKLLNELAWSTDGRFAFVPDAGFVGTVFVKAMSTVCSTCALDVQVTVPNARVSAASTVHRTTQVKGETTFHLGNMQFGQPKTLLLRSANGDSAGSSSEIRVAFTKPAYDRVEELHVLDDGLEDAVTVAETRARALVVSTLRHAKRCADIQETITKIGTLAEAHPSAYLDALQQDLGDQIMQAYSRSDWYNRWGDKFILSITMAHLHQVCNNFKDPGVQHYGGALTSMLSDHIDTTFNTLPPPEPSLRTATTVTLDNLAVWNDASGGCFDGNCTVQLASGRVRRVADLQAGDAVRTAKGTYEAIECIVKTVGQTRLVGVGDAKKNNDDTGLFITKWHPVKLEDGFWAFPTDVSNNEEKLVNEVFSLVMAERSTALVSGIEVATFGNNLTGPVISHEFLGTERVIEDLKKIPGYNNGLVELTHECFRRGPDGMIQEISL